MATTKRKPRRRRRSAVSGTPKKSRVFNGKRYTHKGCSTTKTGAKKTAAALRARGKNARVVKVGSRHCVYSRG